MFDCFDLVYGEPVNCRIKYYGELVGEVLVCDHKVFTAGLEVHRSTAELEVELEAERVAYGLDKGRPAAGPSGGGGPAADTARAARRARASMYDYCMANPDLDCFITLTLSPELVEDRYDYKGLQRRLDQWLDNMVRRHGLRYVMVPEQHKDGAWHYHGLVNRAALKLVDSGHQTKDGKVIYHVENWKLGFTTAVIVDGPRERVCRYVGKYIEKSVGDGGGADRGRWYYHSHDLALPRFEYCNADFGSVENAAEFEAGGRRWKIIR